MNPDFASVEELIDEQLDLKTLRGITTGKTLSDEISSEASTLIKGELPKLCSARFGQNAPPVPLSWLALGSVGRAEATPGSDLDLILVYRKPADPAAEMGILAVDQDIREFLRKELHKVSGISNGTELTAPITVDALGDSAKVGGLYDKVEHLTRRTLILTESRTIFSSSTEDLRVEAKRAVLTVYQGSTITRGKHLLSLINDIVRYYRTLCVDYKSRVDTEMKPWAIRNLKLRHSKKYWYFSTAIAIVSATADCDHATDSEEVQVDRLLDLPPTYRLAYALAAAELRPHMSILRLFDRFLFEIGDEGVRDTLKEVDHKNRYDNERYRLLKDNSDRLHVRMLEIIQALPPHWSRHLISHFLL